MVIERLPPGCGPAFVGTRKNSQLTKLWLRPIAGHERRPEDRSALGDDLRLASPSAGSWH
jgi:hypothetical protein